MPSESGGCSSGGRPCGDDCAWKWNFDITDWVPVAGCADPNKWCDKPPRGNAYQLTDCACTGCYSPEQLVALTTAAAKTKLGVRRFGVILPKVDNPKVLGRFTDVVEAGEVGQLFSPEFGWMVKVRNKIGGNQPTSVDPANLPVVLPKFSDSALAVGLMLQNGDQGGLQQYWVNVTRLRPWSLLTTSEWDVLVVRLSLV